MGTGPEQTTNLSVHLAHAANNNAYLDGQIVFSHGLALTNRVHHSGQVEILAGM